MKRIYFLFLFSFLFCNGLFAQTCLPNGITFETQQQIDDFAVNYPGCTEILGSLNIGTLYAPTPTIVNLNGLSQISIVGGTLDIQENDNLSSLAGLENITSIGEDLWIGINSSLTTLNGLGNIQFLGGGLTIDENYNLTDISALSNSNLSTLSHLRIVNNSLTSLEGLESVTEVNDLSIVNEPFTNLQALSNISSINNNLQISSSPSLTNLQGLENVTGSIQSLDIAGNSSLTSIAQLSNLTDIRYLTINNNPVLTSLQGLENIDSIYNELSIGVSYGSEDGNDLLTNLDALQGLNYLGGMLKIIGNQNLTSIEQLSNLTHISSLLIYDNPSLTSLQGLENIDSIDNDLSLGAYSDNIGTYIGNGMLNDLSALQGLNYLGGTLAILGNQNLNNIDFLSGFNTITGLEIIDNSNLSICNLPAICNYLSNGGNSTLSGNAPSCNDALDILSTCPDIAKIQTNVFYDVNQNQIQDAGEPYYSDIPLQITPGNLSTYPIAENANAIIVNSGNYTVAFDETTNPDWQLTTDSSSFFVSLNSSDCVSVSFGIYPTQLISNQSAFIGSLYMRCNEETGFSVITKNLGNTVTSGILWFEVDTNTTSIDFLDSPDTLIAPNVYGWNFTDLYPSQTFSSEINIGIPGPPDFLPGDSLYFYTYVQYADANGSHISTVYEYNPEVQCSYDPNDKLVYPDRTDDFMENYTLFDESLYYTVRFQNTGNAVAYDVVIKDTLDANLDWTTFQYLGSSHADVLTTTMDEDGILTFDFTDIFLPDSTSNFEASQGYVTYLIKGNAGLAENTVIENSAGIYFDLNPPVITNTTENVMVSVLPTISTTDPETLPKVSIFPNPNTGLFEVTGIAEGDYTILNTAGQIIQRGQLSNNLSIDISTAPQGVYFMSITVGEQVLVKRIVKI